MPDWLWVVAFVVVLLGIALYTDRRVKLARHGLTRPATAGSTQQDRLAGVERTGPGAITNIHAPGP